MPLLKDTCTTSCIRTCLRCIVSTHGEQGQGLACALQQAVNSIRVGRVESLLEESLLHHQLHQLLPAVHRLQHPKAGHHTHQQHKLLSCHILQHLSRQRRRDKTLFINVCFFLFSQTNIHQMLHHFYHIFTGQEIRQQSSSQASR